MNTFDKIKSIVVDRLDVEEGKITEDTNFMDDLGCDSLDLYELLQGLEEAFKISISEDLGKNLKTVKDVVSYIDSLEK